MGNRCRNSGRRIGRDKQQVSVNGLFRNRKKKRRIEQAIARTNIAVVDSVACPEARDVSFLLRHGILTDKRKRTRNGDSFYQTVGLIPSSNNVFIDRLERDVRGHLLNGIIAGPDAIVPGVPAQL